MQETDSTPKLALRFDSVLGTADLDIERWALSVGRSAVPTAAERSNHAKLHPAGFADHVLVPRWIPNELNVSFVDAVDA
jgi:hypothetical protein